MKKVFKNPFFMFILGAIICGSVGVIANGLTAKEIIFESNGNWKANTVEQALNDLYAARVPNNYSTEEKIVGQWIDGKPLYQKTIIETVSTYTDGNKRRRFIYQYDSTFNVISAEGYTQEVAGGSLKNILGRMSVDADMVNIAHSSVDDRYLYYDRIKSAGVTSVQFVVTLRYTKTTDQGA